MSETPAPSRQVVRFGAFELDLRVGELRKAGVRVSLQDQPFKVLECLVKSGAFVAKYPEAAVPMAMKFLGQPEPIVRRVLLEPAGRVKTGELFPVLDDLDRIQKLGEGFFLIGELQLAAFATGEIEHGYPRLVGFNT